MRQRDLVEDHLGAFADLIAQTAERDDFVLSQVLIWSVVNYVPLRKFAPERLQVAFYEDFCAAPAAETERIRRFIDPQGALGQVPLPGSLVGRPSRMARRTRADLAGQSPTDWRDELASEQIERGRRILERFGLDELYDDDGASRPHGLAGFRRPG